MKISLITVCYNNADTIGDTIDSVLSQNYSELEYVIVDGLSTDGTLDVIESKKKPFFRIVSEKDNGIYDALNKGISMSTGNVLGMLHADDVFASPNVLTLVADKFNSGSYDAVYGDLFYVDRNNLKKISRKWISGEYKKNSFKWGWMPPHPTFYVKKTVYDKYGKFNLDIHSAADYELMLRFIHKYNVLLGYIPEVMVKMRVGGQSNVSFKNRMLANAEDQYAWEINDLKPFWFTRFLKPLRKIFQFIRK